MFSMFAATVGNMHAIVEVPLRANLLLR